MATANKSTDVSITPFGEGSPRRLPFKVVVCGLGRMGTTSMKTALNILGFPAYHATDLWVDSREHVEIWNRAIDWKYNGKGAFSRQDWDEILGDYMSAVDVPAGFFATDLAEAYPDAKVVILTREPDTWFRSCHSAFTRRSLAASVIYRIIFFWDARVWELARYMDKKQDEVWGFEWHAPGAREKALAFYERYYADCRARVPEERRIEFQVQDGWGPLCAHLGVEVPMVSVGNEGEMVEVPFPRTNEAAEFREKVGKMRKTMMKRALRDWAEKIALGTAAGYGLYVYGRPVFWGAMRLLKGRLA